MGTLTDTTRSDDAQGAIAEVIDARAMIPHPGGVPPVPAMTALDAERHHAGIERIRTRSDPPDAIHALLHRVALCWLLWGQP